jgi:hypothetical protein
MHLHQTCQVFRTVVGQPWLWYQMYGRRYGAPPIKAQDFENDLSWRQRYEEKGNINDK